MYTTGCRHSQQFSHNSGRAATILYGSQAGYFGSSAHLSAEKQIQLSLWTGNKTQFCKTASKADIQQVYDILQIKIVEPNCSHGGLQPHKGTGMYRNKGEPVTRQAESQMLVASASCHDACCGRRHQVHRGLGQAVNGSKLHLKACLDCCCGSASCCHARSILLDAKIIWQCKSYECARGGARQRRPAKLQIAVPARLQVHSSQL